MSTHKHIDAICIVVVLFTLLLTVLFMNGEALGISVIASEENSSDMFTANDQDAAWDTADATVIVLSDDGSTVNGNGAYVNEGNVCIVYAGKYIVSGSLSNGKITVEAEGDDKIWLMLDGVSIHCEDDAALRIEQAGKVFLTLKDGTENTLSSGSTYTDEAVSANVDGTIYSRDDLTVNGGGSLKVTAGYQHGIVCNDDLAVTGGTISVNAPQDGLHANDSVRIKDAALTISAGDDGITVSNDDETAFLYIESGTVSISSCYEGLEAITVTIAGGTIDIASTDDGINANGSGGSSVINITGGDITITNQNGRDADGIDSNKDIFISGGKLLVSVPNDGSSSAIDYGSEYGGVCEISGGTVLACGSSGMAEGFDSSSTQGFLMYTTSAEAGTVVTLKDAEGNELITETVPYSFSSVLVSTPEMEVGDTCTLTVGETEEELTIDNVSSTAAFGRNVMPGGGGFGGGRQRGQMFNGSDDTPSELPQGETGDGTAAPGLQQDGANGAGAPPELPQDGTNGAGAPPELPQDGTNGSDATPQSLQNGTNNSGAASESQQDGANSSGSSPESLQNGTDGSGTAATLPQDKASRSGTTSGLQPDKANVSEIASESQDSTNDPGTTPDANDPGTASGAQNSANDPGTTLESQSNANDSDPAATPESQQDNGTVGGPQGKDNMQFQRGGRDQKMMPNQEAMSQAVNAGVPVSTEDLLLLGLSALILATGCIIAFFYKQRA